MTERETSEHKKNFDKEWDEYILGFIDEFKKENELSTYDLDTEAWDCGCDISLISERLSYYDFKRVKRYRNEK